MWAWRKPCPHCFLSSTLRHYFGALWSFSGKESTKQPTSQKAKAETVAIPKIGDVSRTKMR